MKFSITIFVLFYVQITFAQGYHLQTKKWDPEKRLTKYDFKGRPEIIGDSELAASNKIRENNFRWTDSMNLQRPNNTQLRFTVFPDNFYQPLTNDSICVGMQIEGRYHLWEDSVWYNYETVFYADFSYLLDTSQEALDAAQIQFDIAEYCCRCIKRHFFYLRKEHASYQQIDENIRDKKIRCGQSIMFFKEDYKKSTDRKKTIKEYQEHLKQQMDDVDYFTFPEMISHF